MGAAVEVQAGCATITVDQPDGLGGASHDDDAGGETVSVHQPVRGTSTGGTGSGSAGSGGSTSSAGGGTGTSEPAGGAPSGTGGEASGGAVSGSGGDSSGSGGSTTASGGSGTGGSGEQPTCDDAVSMAQAVCGDVILYQGKLFQCASQASGVNEEPSGCGNPSVYCNTTAPDHDPWGPTAWNEISSCD